MVRERIEAKIEAERYDNRVLLTLQALSIFLDEPIWGKGYDFFYRYEGETFNHLWYLNVLVAYGIFGLMFVFVWFTRIFPVKTFFISPYSMTLVSYISIFLLLAPPVTFLSIAMAFLYQEKHVKSCVNIYEGTLRLYPRRPKQCAKFRNIENLLEKI
jgi:hypothetical protein